MENGDAVADGRYRLQIVRDVKHGNTQLVIEFQEQVEDFGLRDCVESAGGFVRDEQ